MHTVFQFDWKHVFLPDLSILELIVRGSSMYLALLVILRLIPRRQVGGVGVSDLLVILLFANAVQNAMVGTYSSITDGLVLLATLVCWNYLFNWLGFKFPRFQRFLTPSPLLLVKDGQIIQENLQRGLISKRELMSQIRQQGISSLIDVKKAYIEGDGRISIFTEELDEDDDREPLSNGSANG